MALKYCASAEVQWNFREKAPKKALLQLRSQTELRECWNERFSIKELAGISLKKCQVNTFYYGFATSSMYDIDSASQLAAHRPLKQSEEKKMCLLAHMQKQSKRQEKKKSTIEHSTYRPNFLLTINEKKTTTKNTRGNTIQDE